MSSISLFMRRIFFLFSFVLVFQFLFLPSVGAAVEPWEGTPWEGTPWQGIPWEGKPWEGNESDPGETSKDDWDSKSGEKENPANDDPFDEKGNSNEAINTEKDNLCLPLPSNDWGEQIRSSGSTVTDEKRNEMLQNTVNKVIQDLPVHLRAAVAMEIMNNEEEFVEEMNNKLDTLLDRPHGTIDDIDISSDELASLAKMGYSDDKIKDFDTPEGKTQEEKLMDSGWEEKGSRNHWSGFEGRVFVNEDDGTIAFSFGGTEHKRDYGADLLLATGRETGQYAQAEEFVEEMMKRYPDYQPVLVGHSLGGAIAQHISMKKQIPATTFNAPGIGTREYSFSDTFFKDGGWKADPIPFLLKAGINEGSLNPLVDQLNRNGFYNDLVENNVMENDEIGTYQIHLGQTNTYTEDGDVTISNDYSDEAHDSDLPALKSQKTLIDILDNVPSHGMKNFIDIMEDCY